MHKVRMVSPFVLHSFKNDCLLLGSEIFKHVKNCVKSITSALVNDKLRPLAFHLVKNGCTLFSVKQPKYISKVTSIFNKLRPLAFHCIKNNITLLRIG